MMKGINAFLLFMTIAVSATAGDISLNPVSADNTAPDQKKNAVSKPVVREKYEYYEVCGCCEKDLQSELKQKCITWNDGKKYDSVTNWRLKWDYGHSRAPEACTTDSFTVTVDIIFHLPKWARTADAPQPLIEKWEKYSKNLLLHEQSHRDIAVAAAAELSRAVAELPPSRTCAELDREVRNLSNIRMGKLIDDQKKYDAATNHGLSQGAVFP